MIYSVVDNVVLDPLPYKDAHRRVNVFVEDAQTNRVPSIQLVVIGAAPGTFTSFATNQLLTTQLWNVSPHDPVTLALAIRLITVIAFAACYIPARRAMFVDPIGALRDQ